MNAAERRYREWIAREYPECLCGAERQHFHHIIHLNFQRITKDEMLVIGLCHRCHNGGDASVHALGGERQFLETTGLDLVQLSVLRRHDWEVRGRP
jgi:hypothetical protein